MMRQVEHALFIKAMLVLGLLVTVMLLKRWARKRP